MTMVASIARVDNAGSGPSTARVDDAIRVLNGARVGTADAAPLDEASASFLFLFLSILSAQPLGKLRNQGYFCRKTLGMFKQT